ncbi:hypothetical protein STSP2_01107 [Anaerohalosphaera lusitana]|uniref:Uncharacterized protein n=1 Tax=Anaerohalosphaera lusitana TaxID=1936003 RepID=A0A1U9NJF7_9BACT|nr:hypothetical protein [Anaerohalosphaera lusitana]AQT67955.1 hypothetical protein STSP2_01107 [Anaerohalosphaera lusitana]
MRKVKSGEPLNIPAQTYNTFIDAAQDYKSRQLNTEGTARLTPENQFILVKNETNQTCPRFSVVGINGPVIEPGADIDGFVNSIALKGELPSEQSKGRFAILLEPAAPGQIIRAAISGICCVRIEVYDESHSFAQPIAGDASRLQSSENGSATILWKEAGTGLKWSLVRLDRADTGIRMGVIVDSLGGDSMFVGQLYGPAGEVVQEKLDVICNVTDIPHVEVGAEFAAVNRSGKWWCLAIYGVYYSSDYLSSEVLLSEILSSEAIISDESDIGGLSSGEGSFSEGSISEGLLSSMLGSSEGDFSEFFSSEGVLSSDLSSDDVSSDAASSEQGLSSDFFSSDADSSEHPSSDDQSSELASSEALSSEGLSSDEQPSSDELTQSSGFPSSDGLSSDFISSDWGSSDFAMSSGVSSEEALSSDFPSSDLPSSDALSSDLWPSSDVIPSSDEIGECSLVPGPYPPHVLLTCYGRKYVDGEDVPDYSQTRSFILTRDAPCHWQYSDGSYTFEFWMNYLSGQESCEFRNHTDTAPFWADNGYLPPSAVTAVSNSYGKYGESIGQWHYYEFDMGFASVDPIW